jgi:hypothetical protein
MRHVARELAGPVDRDSLRHLAGFVQDLDLAGLNDEELKVPVADLEELFPSLVPFQYCTRASPQRSDMALVECGEGDGPQIVLSHVLNPQK